MLKGIQGIFASKKGVLSLLVLASTCVIAMTGHMDASVAACLAIVQGIYCWTAHKVDMAAINVQG
jgi:hypothetical protein